MRCNVNSYCNSKQSCPQVFLSQNRHWSSARLPCLFPVSFQASYDNLHSLKIQGCTVVCCRCRSFFDSRPAVWNVNKYNKIHYIAVYTAFINIIVRYLIQVYFGFKLVMSTFGNGWSSNLCSVCQRIFFVQCWLCGLKTVILIGAHQLLIGRNFDMFNTFFWGIF